VGDALQSLPESLRRALASVRSVGVITGAGISAESGIPTYRGKGGVYDDPELGDRVMEDVSGHTLASDPDRTWRTVARMALHSQRAEPNAAHRAIAAIEQKVERFVLLTQNVDGLHQRAGSRNVIDIHGNSFETLCMKCGEQGRMDTMEGVDAAPRCGRCGGILRPDVVLFGELLPMHKYQRILEEFHYRAPDLVLAVGTSALFPYIIEPVLVARRLGRLTVEVNPEPSTVTPLVDHFLQERAGLALPWIAEAFGAGAG
jgi:NAD-dependent deacetylase